MARSWSTPRDVFSWYDARAPWSKGSWTLPGGRVEKGESLVAAVIRELREETALDAQVVATLGEVTLAREGFVYVIHEHLAVAVGGTTPQAGDDAADARWASRADVDVLGVGQEAIAVIDLGLAEARARGLCAAISLSLRPLNE